MATINIWFALVLARREYQRRMKARKPKRGAVEVSVTDDSIGRYRKSHDWRPRRALRRRKADRLSE
jgi:hypothetical protein